MSGEELQTLLGQLASLYKDVTFEYNPEQAGLSVMKSGRLLGTVRAEGALHTVIWAALGLAEKEA